MTLKGTVNANISNSFFPVELELHHQLSCKLHHRPQPLGSSCNLPTMQACSDHISMLFLGPVSEHEYSDCVYEITDKVSCCLSSLFSKGIPGRNWELQGLVECHTTFLANESSAQGGQFLLSAHPLTGKVSELVFTSLRRVVILHFCSCLPYFL